MKPLIIIFCIFYSLFAKAQSMPQKGKWSAGITANMATPGSAYIALQPCAEFLLNNRFSFVGSFSFKFINIDQSKKDITNEKYRRVLLEGRYRFTKKENIMAAYIGLQLTRSARKFTQINSSYLYEFNDDSTTFFTRANINSPVTTVSLQFGVCTNGKKRLYADFFLGLGARFTHTKFADLEGKKRDLILETPKPFTWESGLEIARPYTFIHLNAGLRLFYRLNTKGYGK